MNFNNSIPIYMQIINELKKDIITGKLSPGEKLPSTRELAIKYSINPNTSGRIYKEMEREEITFTKRGLGTFVTESVSKIEQIRDDMAKDLINDFIKGMTELGYTNEMLISIIKKESEEK
ncbi:GntR family transcriptional regulator [Vallitalea sp.]|uniref:GntR family transcriptional regulator n=1 Tax=Vallitalea sp. TaxID=1882829 RepID=UPI002600BD27|nr:GntR family transcriptional regulator [Vallitalea sp.]MCT4686327.1 GntR family transcriptional regulator [Vallitalea sp.]